MVLANSMREFTSGAHETSFIPESFSICFQASDTVAHPSVSIRGWRAVCADTALLLYTAEGGFSAAFEAMASLLRGVGTLNCLFNCGASPWCSSADLTSPHLQAQKGVHESGDSPYRDSDQALQSGKLA